VVQLLDAQATGEGIRSALADLAACARPDDTAVVFFSGHSAHQPDLTGLPRHDQQARGNSSGLQYVLPYDCDLANMPGTAISGEEMTVLLRDIQAGRLLVLFDSCHSGGAGDPKGALPQFKAGLSERYYETLA
jgi:uncharacterized caspase-like protein